MSARKRTNSGSSTSKCPPSKPSSARKVPDKTPNMSTSRTNSGTSTSKCPPPKPSSARKVSDKSPNMPTSRKNLDKTSNILSTSETVFTDPTHSQKYMQHKLDMAYNKYIQNLALDSILSKMHQEAERAYDEEQVHYEEMYESVEDELKYKKNYISDITTTIENDLKIQSLETALQDISKYMDENKTIDKLNIINKNLQLICDNLNFENITFVSNEENYTKLENIFKELAKLMEEINEGNNEDFNNLVDNITKSRDLIIKLRQNHEKARHCQNKLNKLVLKTVSLELSKTKEDDPCATPI